MFTDDGIIALCENKVNLTELNINKNHFELSSKIIMAISFHLTKLQSLSIKNDQLTVLSYSPALIYLSKIKTLKRLFIDNFSRFWII